MKRNVSVVCVVSLTVATRSSSILISGKIIKEMPCSVASGTHCISLKTKEGVIDVPFKNRTEKKYTGCAAKYSFLTLQQVGHAGMSEFYMIKAHNTGEAVSISPSSGHALRVR